MKYAGFLIIFLVLNARATELPLYNYNVRALGMGSAFSTVVDDKDALFINPAGLSKVKGINVTIMDPAFGANGREIVEVVQNNAQSTSTSYVNSLRSLYGKNVWIGAGAQSALALPGFAFSIYDRAELGAYLSNPVFPTMNFRYSNDVGFATGMSFNILPSWSIGFTGQRIQRTGGAFPLGLSTIGSLEANSITSQLNTTGTGYSVSMGTLITIPTPVKPSFAFVWNDIGQTKFATSPTLTAPPPIRDEMTFGFGLAFESPIVDIRPAIDFKHLNWYEEQIGKKIHIGVELDFPFLAARAGFNQGYYTMGAGIDMGVLRLDLATWGVELGEYPGQHEDRRYMAQITLELGFDPNLNFLGGSKAGGSGSGRAKGIKLRR